MSPDLLAELNRRRPNARIAPGDRVPVVVHPGSEPSSGLLRRADEVEAVLDSANDPDAILEGYNLVSQVGNREVDLEANRKRSAELARICGRLTRGDQRRLEAIDRIARGRPAAIGARLD